MRLRPPRHWSKQTGRRNLGLWIFERTVLRKHANVVQPFGDIWGFAVRCQLCPAHRQFDGERTMVAGSIGVSSKEPKLITRGAKFETELPAKREIRLNVIKHGWRTLHGFTSGQGSATSLSEFRSAFA